VLARISTHPDCPLEDSLADQWKESPQAVAITTTLRSWTITPSHDA
jgi:hypothetical protein